MTVLSISRQFGAGGWTLASSVANRLGYRFVSSEVINRIAKESNVSVEWIKGVEKDAGDWLMRYISKMVPTSFMTRHLGDTKSDFDENRYISFLQCIVIKIADEDNIVILGRGSQYILQDYSNAFHILVVADLEDRIKFLEEIWKISRKEAEKAIRIREKRRDVFLKYFEKGHPNSLGLYHLIINTSKMSLKQAEDLIVWVVQGLMEPPCGIEPQTSSLRVRCSTN